MDELNDFLDEDGRLGEPTEGKSVADLERVIALSKPDAVIEKYAVMVEAAMQWAWVHEYIHYLNDLHDWQKASVNFVPVETYLDEEQGIKELSKFDLPEPVKPIRPTPREVFHVLAPYFEARRRSAYPDVRDFADAYVHLQQGDTTVMDEYVEKCMAVKTRITR